MKKLMVLMLLLMGLAAAAESWQSWSSPDGKFSLDLPGTPSKEREQDGIVLWKAQEGEEGVYMVVTVDAKLSELAPDKQDELAHYFAEQFFEGAEIKTSSEKKLTDGYEFAGVMGEGQAATAAQVRKAASQNRIYILLAVGQTDSGRVFNSFKVN